jgi:hypothetical protein
MLYSILSQINKGLRRIDILRSLGFSIQARITDDSGQTIHIRFFSAQRLTWPLQWRRTESGDQPGTVPVLCLDKEPQEFGINLFYNILYILAGLKQALFSELALLSPISNEKRPQNRNSEVY